MDQSTAVFYCSHPDIHPSVPSGYATHINGVVGGLEANGVKTVMCLAGRQADTQASETTPPTSAPSKSLIRRAVPTMAWNALRDARLASFDRRTARTLDQTLEDQQISLVYERFTHLHHQGPRVARRRKVNHVLEVNSPPSERSDLGGKSPFDAVAVSRARSAILATTVGVFVSSALKSAFQEICDDALDHTIVVPNGIDPTLLDSPSTAPDASLDANVLIGFTGSLFEWHGLDLLIHAFAELLPDYQGTRLVIVGDGPALASLQLLASELDVTDKVEFTGAVAHETAIQRTKRFDIAVMAKSNWYGSPTKLVEYAATGRAIIAPSTGPVGDVFTHELNALITPPTAQDLEMSLRRLISEPSLRLQLGNEAKRMALESLSWEALVARILLKVEEVNA